MGADQSGEGRNGARGTGSPAAGELNVNDATVTKNRSKRRHSVGFRACCRVSSTRSRSTSLGCYFNVGTGTSSGHGAALMIAR
jgi:hypothetical protein